MIPMQFNTTVQTTSETTFSTLLWSICG